ncbi:MAG TPA: hypothetical protein VFD70_05710 [Anaerolineae bacterium]|nr:hypothetical protein [Anaerolineae bacterium]
MQPSRVNELVTQAIRETSGLVTHRPYLGMSQIARCSRQLYFDFVEGREHQSDRAHQNCKRGYLIEGEFKTMLAAMGVIRVVTGFPAQDHETGALLYGCEREIIAPFDSRFRGHTDGETVDGDLLEIKSMTQEKFEKALQLNRIDVAHYWQVQAYMRYGEYSTAIVEYVSSETFDHHAFRIAINPRLGAEMEAKAKAILAAIDTHNAPRCECGKCQRNGSRS